MNDSNNNHEIQDVLGKLFEVKTRYVIITALREYKHSMNIKMLAKLLGKSESTIFHHLSAIQEFQPDIIQVDQFKTKKQRGIFYTLSDPVREYYQKLDSGEVFEKEIPDLFSDWLQKTDEEIVNGMIERIKQQPDLGNITKKARQALAYHHAIEDFALNSFEKSEEAIKNGLIPVREDFPFGGYTLLSLTFKISSARHSLQIGRVISEFVRNMNDLKKEIEEEMKKNHVNPEDMITDHYHIFGGIINEFKFRKK
jgi:hypothetical protein